MYAHTLGDDPTAATRPPAFRISESDLDPGCREVRVEGELDLAVADQLRVRLEMAAADGVEVIVCLDRCDFIDSTGIAVIVMAHRELARRGRRLVIRDPSPRVARTLQIIGLDQDDLLLPDIETR